jgi:hypothetical protein
MKVTLVLGVLTGVLSLGEPAFAEHAEPDAARGFYGQEERREDMRERILRQREEMRQELQRRRSGAPERPEGPCRYQPAGTPPRPGC